MIQRRLRFVALIAVIFTLLLAACGPQETPTPEPTDIPPTAEEVVEEPTEEVEEVATEAVAEETEEADMEATEEMADMEATEEMADMEATEEMADMEATEEMADMEATEEMADMEATEEMGDMGGMGMRMPGTSATYMLITNNGEEDITLLSANAEIATVTEVHQTIIENDVARMEEMVDGLVIPAGETVMLQPGGFHVMLIELQGDLIEGETVAVSLEFDNGESITIDAPIANEAPAESETYEIGDLTIEAVWARPTAVMEMGGMGDMEATEEMADMEATEEMADMEATEEMADMEATEEMADMEATEEMADMEATEEMADMEATEEMADMEATEEMADMEATEEMADMEATEEMADMEATEEMADMEEDMGDVEMATYEGAYSFDYPADFEVLESGTTDLVTLTRDEQRIVVVGPEAYATIVGGQEFDNDSDELAFFLNRSGYTLGEETTMMMGLASYEISFPRNEQVGAATLIDLDNGRRGVVIELGSDADNVPGAEGAGIMGSILYPADLVDVAVSTEGFSTLVTAVQTAGLEGTLRSGEYTVFAPTDDAFAAALEALGMTAEELLADTELLTSVLTYHVVEGIVTSDMLEDGMEVATVNGETLIVNVSEDGVTVTDGIGNTYNVTMADVTASNGVIHVIDGVLLPPADEEVMEMTEEPVMEETEEAAPEATEEPEMEATEEMGDMDSELPTIAGLAVETRDLSSLASAVFAADLFDTLEGEGEFTVFAPTNDAFNATLEALDIEFADLAADTDLLTSILTYHVVAGTVTSDMLEDGMEVETLNGAILTVNVSEDGVTVTDSAGNAYNVVTADVMASNGVVHIIDGVLLPPME